MCRRPRRQRARWAMARPRSPRRQATRSGRGGADRLASADRGEAARRAQIGCAGDRAASEHAGRWLAAGARGARRQEAVVVAPTVWLARIEGSRRVGLRSDVPETAPPASTLGDGSPPEPEAPGDKKRSWWRRPFG